MNTNLEPQEVRAQIRSGEWQDITAGTCLGYVQANLVILPEALAMDFEALCAANPQALPLIERTVTGTPHELGVAPGADLRTDLPRYHVFRHGTLVEERHSIEDLWRDDLVGFLFGCSFSAENQLLRAGVRLRHLQIGRGIPMFKTTLECKPAGAFHGPIVVSMRPIAVDQLDKAIEVTKGLPFAHGAPLHVGDPAVIGITDVMAPDWGDPLRIAENEVPVFWACGVTPQAVIQAVRPPFAVTHAPQHMFITDLTDEELNGNPPAN